ncbi:hypothetical protein FIBSPDRAFT_887239 [Athelia psychrophila]|uniref:Uncharacterized protein n=1 Tax=Athelia psychrophila TaxID=1759441 RepID=A0A166PTU9_9AGAM|nr:hypothetical protein FIBSPDRAFT_887239 [Fibularhizoctonia sp. CBS 109695]
MKPPPATSKLTTASKKPKKTPPAKASGANTRSRSKSKTQAQKIKSKKFVEDSDVDMDGTVEDDKPGKEEPKVIPERPKPRPKIRFADTTQEGVAKSSMQQPPPSSSQPPRPTAVPSMNIMSPEISDAKLSKLPGWHPDVKAALKHAFPQPALMSKSILAVESRHTAPAPSPSPSPPPSSRVPSRSIHSYDRGRDRNSTYRQSVARSRESARDNFSNERPIVPSAAPSAAPSPHTEYRRSGTPLARLHPERRGSAPQAAPSPLPDYHGGYGAYGGYGSQDTRGGYDAQGAHGGYSSQGAQGGYPGYTRVEERHNGHYVSEHEWYGYAPGSSGYLSGPGSRGYDDPFNHRFQPAHYTPSMHGTSYPVHDPCHYDSESHRSRYLQAPLPSQHHVPYAPPLSAHPRRHPDDLTVISLSRTATP